MKNIHILPTDKPSLVAMLPGKELTYSKTKQLFTPTVDWKTQNIYITSDEEIKEGDYFIALDGSNDIYEANKVWLDIIKENPNPSQKIILTTDVDLIKDGVQAIDDEFLEWFVKNSSCEVVKIEKEKVILGQVAGTTYTDFNYKIIIPKEDPKYTTSNLDNEKYKDYSVAKQRAKNYMSLKGALEPKQETLEEAAEGYSERHQDVSGNLGKYLVSAVFQDGANWQQERMYSEEDLREAFRQGQDNMDYSEIYGWDTKLTEQKWFEQFKKK